MARRMRSGSCGSSGSSSSRTMSRLLVVGFRVQGLEFRR